VNLIYLAESENFPDESIKRLETKAQVVTDLSGIDKSNVTVAFVRLSKYIGPEFHLEFPSLKYVVSPTTGVNHIDMRYFSEHGIRVITLRGHYAFLDNIHATAEHTLAIVLALFRQVPQAYNSVSNGQWNRYPFKGRELHGKSVLVLGYGRVGSQVAFLYESFGCKVSAHDLHDSKIPLKYKCDFSDALSQCDLLSIHVDLSDSNYGLVSESIINAMKESAVVVNTSRGELIDQKALLNALMDKRIAAAAIDVLHDEPEPINEMVRESIKVCGPRLLITPHISGFTEESLPKVENFVTSLLLEELD
jgi:D-3-phosphoglycerate dehydrogenase / 2-oxoglutarate reductase